MSKKFCYASIIGRGYDEKKLCGLKTKQMPEDDASPETQKICSPEHLSDNVKTELNDTGNNQGKLPRLSAHSVNKCPKFSQQLTENEVSKLWNQNIDSFEMLPNNCKIYQFDWKKRIYSHMALSEKQNSINTERLNNDQAYCLGHL